MSLVIRSGSRQYVVDYGQKIIVDFLKEKKEGDSVDLDLIYGYGDDEKAKKIQAKIIGHQRGKKTRVVKYKSKSNYHRQYGARQMETILEILKPAK